MHQSIGFIGIGNMGAPMARHLLRAGERLRVYDLDPAKVAALVAEGAASAASPADTAEAGGIVFSMVPNDAALEDIVTGEGGVLERLGAGGVHVSCSTISPHLARRMAALYDQRGSSFVVATVSGRPDVAEAGQLSIVYNGPEEAKARVRPYLSAIGNPDRLYDLGKQQAAAAGGKLALNHLICAIILALADSTALAEQSGIPPASFIRLVRESPLFAGKVFEYGDMIAADTYQPALFPVPLGIKDIQLMLEASKAVGVQLPTAERFLDCLRQAETVGRSQDDWAVAARAITCPSKVAFLPSATGSST